MSAPSTAWFLLGEAAGSVCGNTAVSGGLWGASLEQLAEKRHKRCRFFGTFQLWPETKQWLDLLLVVRTGLGFPGGALSLSISGSIAVSPTHPSSPPEPLASLPAGLKSSDAPPASRPEPGARRGRDTPGGSAGTALPSPGHGPAGSLPPWVCFQRRQGRGVVQGPWPNAFLGQFCTIGRFINKNV